MITEDGRPVGDGLTWRTNLPPTIQDDFSTAYKPTEPKTMIAKIVPVPSNEVSQISNNNVNYLIIPLEILSR